VQNLIKIGTLMFEFVKKKGKQFSKKLKIGNLGRLYGEEISPKE